MNEEGTHINEASAWRPAVKKIFIKKYLETQEPLERESWRQKIGAGHRPEGMKYQKLKTRICLFDDYLKNIFIIMEATFLKNITGSPTKTFF